MKISVNEFKAEFTRVYIQLAKIQFDKANAYFDVIKDLDSAE